MIIAFLITCSMDPETAVILLLTKWFLHCVISPLYSCPLCSMALTFIASVSVGSAAKYCCEICCPVQ